MPRTWTPPLSAAVLFPFLSVSDFFESKEKGHISTVLLTGSLGLIGTVMGQLLSSSSSSSWVGFGFSSSEQRQESWDSEWNCFLFRNTQNIEQDR